MNLGRKDEERKQVLPFLGFRLSRVRQDPGSICCKACLRPGHLATGKGYFNVDLIAVLKEIHQSSRKPSQKKTVSVNIFLQHTAHYIVRDRGHLAVGHLPSILMISPDSSFKHEGG